jgi:hypothetical protein
MIRSFATLGLALSLGTLGLGTRGCVTYEFDQEFWLRVDGSGSTTVTAPPWVWVAFKRIGDPRDPEGTVTPEVARAAFEASGLRVQNARRVTRQGRTYVSVTAGFADLNRLSGGAAFPDLVMNLTREGQRLRFFGVWRRPIPSPSAVGPDRGVMAVRFHLPSRVYDHRNATDGVERGNILSWKQDLRSGISGAPIDFGATIGDESILGSTLRLFLLAALAAGTLIALLLYVLSRRAARPRRARRRGGHDDSEGPDFSKYDPTTGS